MFKTDYCGYNHHNPDMDIIYRPEGSGDYLFLYISAPMVFYFPYDKDSIDNSQNPITRDGISLVKKQALPGDCILFSPGKIQYYQAEGIFLNSFVHFTCEAYEIQGIQIPMDTLFKPSSDDMIVDVLRRIQFEYLSKQPRRERMIDLLVKELLIAAERSLLNTSIQDQQTELFSFLSSFRVNMLKRCSEEWNIEKICKETHLGRSQLYHYYKTFFYTSPKDDLIAARIDKAKHLLTNKELRITDVALQCGFTNIYHFNRYFKRELGCTPSQYRQY